MAGLKQRKANASDGHHPDKSPLRRKMENLGMSESVMAAAEQGHYTDQQLEFLMEKKAEVNRLVAQALEAGQSVEGATQKPVDFDSSPEVSQETPCQIIACHACRPYFKDRISMSFESVFDDEVEPLSPAEAKLLPVKSAQILKNISYHPMPAPPASEAAETTPSMDMSVDMRSLSLSNESASPSQSSLYTYKTTQTELEVMKANRRSRHRFYGLGHRSSGELSRDLSRQMPQSFRQGLKETFKSMFRATARNISSLGSNITLPLPKTALARDSESVSAMGEFDLGALRRLKRQKDRHDLRQERENVSGAGEQNGCNDPLGRQFSLGTRSDSESSGSVVTAHSRGSEGSEVEVEGGVALTEEAVESQTPDIISSLDSIMTQV